ncbi:MAG: hypothetical protein ACTS2F_30275 [Thainema sp.]
MDTEFPVSELPARYDIARSQIYARLDALKQRDESLVPEKRGKKSYVDEKLIKLLDSMHVLISQQGETVSDAADRVLSVEPQTRPMSPMSPVRQVYRTQDTSLVYQEQPSELAVLLSAIAGQQKQPDMLDRYRQLDEIAEKGWELPTHEISEILGLKTLSGTEFERHGFKFIRCGKVGSQSAWKVEKL